jgi:hypothetical protein
MPYTTADQKQTLAYSIVREVSGWTHPARTAFVGHNYARSPPPTNRQPPAAQVAMHSATEEAVVYPAMRAYMGPHDADHLQSEHQKIKVGGVGGWGWGGGRGGGWK